MTDQIKDLIEKIQQEGVEAAQEKAKQIEEEARQQAQAMVEQARGEARQIISQAKHQAVGFEQSAQLTLEQAGRDLLLKLRDQINAMLKKIILQNVRLGLTPGELVKILATLIKDSGCSGKQEIIVTLSESDLKKIKEDFFKQLSEEVKKGLALRSSQDISGGFIISYDGGKSYFDFSDEKLAQGLSTQLKPKLADILDASAKTIQKK